MHLKYFRVKKGERALVFSLGTLHFLIIFAFTLARIARDGLFLSELPASYLPYVYLGLAGWTALAVFIFGKFTIKRSAHNSLAFALCTTGISLILFAFWFANSPRIAAIAFYLWSGAYGLILVSQFWILANERINPREAKRLFGLIGAAGILGGLAGGGAATLLGSRIAAHWILVIIAAVHTTGTVVANKSSVREEEKAPLLPGAHSKEERSLRGVLREPYVRLIALLFLVGGIASAVLDYEFKFFLQARSTGPGEITSMLGLFYGAQNIVALLAQLGLAGFVLSRFGPRKAAIALPVGIVAGSMVVLMAPVFLAVLLTRLYDATLRVSLSRTAWEFLYYPLGDQTRRQARRFIDVVISRSADAGAGLLVLFLNWAGGGGIYTIATSIVTLGLVWIVLEFALSRAYRAQVSRPLQRSMKIRQVEQRPIVSLEPSTDWIALLESDDDSRVLYALAVLRNTEIGAIRERKDLLLRHPSPTVRARALSVLIAGGERLDGLEWSGEAPGAGGEATARFDLAENSADRVAVAAAAGRKIGSRLPRLRLPELIDDPERDVRATAFRSAGQSGDREFVPLLIRKLESPEDRKDAREALALYGDLIVGSLGDLLADDRQNHALRVEICKVLAAIGTQDAAYSLFRAGHLGINRIVMNQVLKALNQIRLRNRSVSLPWNLVRERLEGEILRYCQRLVQQRAVRSIKSDPVRRLLERVLSERAGQSLERIFRRLALVYDTGDTLLAYQGYLSGNSRLRAQSIEYLDTILDADHKQKLLPVLEETSFDRKVRRAGFVLRRGSPSVYGTIMELIESREVWLRAVGLFIIGSMKLEIHIDQVYGCLKSPDEVVRNTAEWARTQLAQ